MVVAIEKNNENHSTPEMQGIFDLYSLERTFYIDLYIMCMSQDGTVQ